VLTNDFLIEELRWFGSYYNYLLYIFRNVLPHFGRLLAGVYNSFAVVLEWYLYSVLNAMGMRCSNNGTDSFSQLYFFLVGSTSLQQSFTISNIYLFITLLSIRMKIRICAQI
jgi:hypothetical protein